MILLLKSNHFRSVRLERMEILYIPVELKSNKESLVSFASGEKSLILLLHRYKDVRLVNFASGEIS